MTFFFSFFFCWIKGLCSLCLMTQSLSKAHSSKLSTKILYFICRSASCFSCVYFVPLQTLGWNYCLQSEDLFFILSLCLELETLAPLNDLFFKIGLSIATAGYSAFCVGTYWLFPLFLMNTFTYSNRIIRFHSNFVTQINKNKQSMLC